MISTFEIGQIEDGFDLDDDGLPNNKLAAIRSLARSAISDAFADVSFVMPVELFDYPTNGPDDCVKLAFYRGSCVGCMPYDLGTPDTLTLDPTSLNANGSARYRFPIGDTVQNGSNVELDARPGVVTFVIPATTDLVLELPISSAIVRGLIVDSPNGPRILQGRVGGVLAVSDLDTVTGLDNAEIGLTAEQSLLDAFFANLLGPLIGLPVVPEGETGAGCRTPDIDVDGDGLEAFCDRDPLDDSNIVDMCIDGDGTMVIDTVDAAGIVTHCTEAIDAQGKRRFVDGISIETNFEAVPAILAL